MLLAHHVGRTAAGRGGGSQSPREPAEEVRVQLARLLQAVARVYGQLCTEVGALHAQTTRSGFAGSPKRLTRENLPIWGYSQLRYINWISILDVHTNNSV